MLLNESKRLTSQHYKIVGLSWAGWTFDFYDLMLFSFLLIPMRSSLGLTSFDMSIVVGFTLLSTAVGGIISGFLADRFGRKTILQLTIIVYSIGAFLCAFSWSFTSLLIFRIITGLGVGGEWATGQAFIAETFPPKFRGKYTGIVQSGAAVGSILAAVVGGFLAPVIGWRLSFLISVLPALIVIIIRKTLTEYDLWLKNREKYRTRSATAEFKKLLNNKHRSKFILALILCIFGMSAYWFTYTWLPEYLNLTKALPLQNTAILVITIQIGAFLGYITFGRVSDSIGRRPAFTIYGILMALGVLMFTLFWDFTFSYPFLIYLFMFIAGIGTGFFTGFAAVFSEIFPTSIRSTAMGSIFNIARGIQFVTPVIIAYLSEMGSEGYGIAIAAIFALLTGLWIWTLPETVSTELGEMDKEDLPN